MPKSRKSQVRAWIEPELAEELRRVAQSQGVQGSTLATQLLTIALKRGISASIAILTHSVTIPNNSASEVENCRTPSVCNIDTNEVDDVVKTDALRQFSLTNEVNDVVKTDAVRQFSLHPLQILNTQSNTQSNTSSSTESTTQPGPPRVSDSRWIKLSAERIYQLYPRKVARGAAIAAIVKALARLPEEPIDDPLDDPESWLMEKVRHFSLTPAGMAGQYCPHPATWFNQSRYLDDPAEWQRSNVHETGNSGQKTELPHCPFCWADVADVEKHKVTCGYNPEVRARLDREHDEMEALSAVEGEAKCKATA